MKQFEKGDITRSFFLKEMGALSLKANREADRLWTDVQDGVHIPATHDIDSSDSEDSLSETRPLLPSSDSDSDQEDPFVNLPRATKKKPRKGTSKPTRPTCPVCGKGFQLGRIPPLHLNCPECTKPTHKRCIAKNVDTFICIKCVPSESEDLPDSG